MKLINSLSYASIMAYSAIYSSSSLSQALCTDGQTKGCIPVPKDTAVDGGGSLFSNTLVWVLSTVVVAITMWALIKSGRALMEKQYQDSAVNFLAAFVVGGMGAILVQVFG